MEVRVIHKNGSNEAEVHVYQDDKLIAKMECYEAFGFQQVDLELPQDTRLEVERTDSQDY